MALISPILRSLVGNGLAFWCPGCNQAHAVHYGDGPGPRWAWSGGPTTPTFRPSVLVQYDHWVPPHIFGLPAPACQQLVKEVCHSFVTDGKIQFLSDCTHKLAGQTVDLPNWPEPDL